MPSNMVQYEESMSIIEVKTSVAPKFRVEILNNSLVVHSDFVLLAR